MSTMAKTFILIPTIAEMYNQESYGNWFAKLIQSDTNALLFIKHINNIATNFIKSIINIIQFDTLWF